MTYRVLHGNENNFLPWLNHHLFVARFQKKRLVEMVRWNHKQLDTDQSGDLENERFI